MIPVQAHMTVLEAARLAIPFYLEAVWSCDRRVTRAKNREQAHRMRIAVKRLRYNLELFSGEVPDDFGVPLKKIKKLQELLGNIHDLDVQIDALQERIGSEVERQWKQWGRVKKSIRKEKRSAAAVRVFGGMLVECPYSGLVELLAHQIDQRERVFVSFLHYWRHLKEINLEKAIRQALFPETAAIGLAAEEPANACG